MRAPRETQQPHLVPTAVRPVRRGFRGCIVVAKAHQIFVVVVRDLGSAACSPRPHMLLVRCRRTTAREAPPPPTSCARRRRRHLLREPRERHAGVRVQRARHREPEKVKEQTKMAPPLRTARQKNQPKATSNCRTAHTLGRREPRHRDPTVGGGIEPLGVTPEDARRLVPRREDGDDSRVAKRRDRDPDSSDTRHHYEAR